jgi:hypothetical protein
MTTRGEVILMNTTPVVCGSGGGAEVHNFDPAFYGVVNCALDVHLSLIGKETVIAPGTMYSIEAYACFSVLSGVLSAQGTLTQLEASPPQVIMNVVSNKISIIVDCGTSGKSLLVTSTLTVRTSEQ